MKKLYLSHNNFTNEYYLDSSFYGKNRIFLERSNIVSKIKKELELKRKTNLYVSDEISEIIINKLETLIEDSKIEMKVVKDLKEC